MTTNKYYGVFYKKTLIGVSKYKSECKGFINNPLHANVILKIKKISMSLFNDNGNLSIISTYMCSKGVDYTVITTLELDSMLSKSFDDIVDLTERIKFNFGDYIDDIRNLAILDALGLYEDIKYLNDKFKKVIKASSYNSMLHYISMFEGMIESIEIDEYSKHHSCCQEIIDKDTIFER